MGVTQELAEWSVGLKYEDIPQSAIHTSKEHILDTLGVAFPGAKDTVGQVITRLARKIGGEPQASIIGGGFKTSVTEAAFANGTMMHALDYDDGVFGGHPSSCVVPVLLALGEWRGSTGKELLLAYNVGLETHGKAHWATTGGQIRKAVHPTPVYGTIGATVAAAKLMGFNTTQTQNALGIASSLAGGLVANFGTMTKPMHAGHAARSGVLAALMTEEGFTGCPDALEHASGYAQAFFGQEGYDLTRWTRDLGNSFRIAYRPPHPKQHPCCGANHPAIDAVIDLHHEYDFTINDVERVTLDVSPQTFVTLRYFEPENEYQAKFCLPYNVAAAVMDGKVDLTTFDEGKIKSQSMKAAMKKVQFITPGEGGAARPAAGGEGEGNAIRIFLKDGRVLVKTLQAARGYIPTEEVITKFRTNAKYVLKSKEAERVKDIILDLENTASIREVMDIVSHH